MLLALTLTIPSSRRLSAPLRSTRPNRSIWNGYAPANGVTPFSLYACVAFRAARISFQVGSGCLDLCWVGCGRVDAVYAGVAGEGWNPWDYAAGWLFAEEGGGTVTQVNREDNLKVLGSASTPVESIHLMFL